MTIFDSWYGISKIIDPPKYQLYLSLRKEREKFLESLREMTYREWKINRRLIEAGGLGKTVYFLPARGGQRSSLPFIKKCFEEGRDVEFITPKKYDYPKLSSKDIETIREYTEQFELYRRLVNLQQVSAYQELLKDFDYFTPVYTIDSNDDYYFDPAYTIDSKGNVRIREISLVRKENKHGT
jgi:hypothetical protein